MEWTTLSLAEQLGNAGSDFERSVRWHQKKQLKLAYSAAGRTLEQLDKTLADNQHAGHRRRELARLREEVCRELFVDHLNMASIKQLQHYFLAFATTARRNAGQ